MRRLPFVGSRTRLSRAAAFLVGLAVSVAFAQSTPDAAFEAGKDFARGGKDAAAGAVSTTTGQQNLPYYNTNAPESSQFGNGRGAVGAAGSQKQIGCQGYRAGSAFDQQDCDAVNFMTRNPTERTKFKIDKNKDPIMTGSRDLIRNPGAAAGTSAQQCHVEQTTIPGKTVTETCTDSMTLDNQSCSKVLSVDVQMSCQQNELMQALDLPRNAVDHVKIFAKCDMAAEQRSYIEMTADSFGIRGGQVRNALVKIPKDVATIPADQWVTTAGKRTGYLLVMTHPDWEYRIRDVPVYILRDSPGCQAGSTSCSYHIYWEWVEQEEACDMNENCRLQPYVVASNEGTATGVIGVTTITDHWDDQCLYLDSRAR
ncbi:hypothetical protein WT05_03900 [Burkholderia stagnalis]|nr:hypothetical protein WT05_03900 [Burkholderia stagnalis]